MHSWFVVIAFVFSSLIGCEICPKADCTEYTCEAEAQKDFEDSPEGCAALDDDGNGEACDEPGNRVVKCPDSASCGCSNLNKDDCNTSCCSWVVGDGCGCREGVCKE